MSGNGKGKISEIEKTETLDEIDDYERLKGEMSQSDIKEIYTHPEFTDNTRLLLTPGDDLIALMMRTNLPSNKFNLGVGMSLQRCQKHKYYDGQNFYKIILAGLPGVRGKRAELYSDTIIGEKTHYTKEGIFQKIKKFAIGGNAE